MCTFRKPVLPSSAVHVLLSHHQGEQVLQMSCFFRSIEIKQQKDKNTFFLERGFKWKKKKKLWGKYLYHFGGSILIQENFLAGKFKPVDDMTIKQNTQILSLSGLTLHAYEKGQEEAEGRS